MNASRKVSARRPRSLLSLIRRFLAASAYRPERHYMRGGRQPGSRSASPGRLP